MVVAGAVVVPLLVWSVKRAGAPVPPVAAVALVAAALGVVAWRCSEAAWARWWWPVPWLLTVVGVPLSLADLKHRRLPDVLTLPAYPAMAVALGLAAATGGGTALLVDAAAGTLVFGGAHLAVHRALPGRMGAGDVKLAGVLGAVLGALGWASMVFAAITAAAVSAVVAVVALRMQVAARARWPDGKGVLAPGDSQFVACDGGFSPGCGAVAGSGGAFPTALGTGGRAWAQGGDNGAAGRARQAIRCGVPHGPALVLAAWTCAVFPGVGSGVVPS